MAAAAIFTTDVGRPCFADADTQLARTGVCLTGLLPESTRSQVRHESSRRLEDTLQRVQVAAKPVDISLHAAPTDQAAASHSRSAGN
jgi:hypothetical protein